MNNPKEKAKELVDKFIEPTKQFHEVHGWIESISSAKECAIIAVDEILDVIGYDYFLEKEWQEVKTEIEKL